MATAGAVVCFGFERAVSCLGVYNIEGKCSSYVLRMLLFLLVNPVRRSISGSN